MADQQRYIVNKFPVKTPSGMFDAIVRTDTMTGKTWVMVGVLDLTTNTHKLKWQIVDDPDLQKQASVLPPVQEINVSGNS
ncbi:MAG: hypothetical protein ACXWP0_04360 [Ktedonobacterales bacterium]